MNLLEKQVPSGLLDKTKGLITPEAIMELQQKENAALAMCGGLLGNCYILAEVAENLMVNAIGKFRKEKWYKQEVKFCLKKAFDETHTTIQNSINNSPTNPDYMREMADAIYALLKDDLWKLNNSVLMELNKRKIANAAACADMVTIDVLLRYINMEYDDVLEYMNTVFKTFYDSWYHPAKCESPAYWWNRGMQKFAKQFIPDDLDLNNIPTIQNGIHIIQNKMHSNEVADAAKAEASKYAEDGGGQEMYEKALEILNLK